MQINFKISQIEIIYQPKSVSVFTAVMQWFLPKDHNWKQTFQEMRRPTKFQPQIVGGVKLTLTK